MSADKDSILAVLREALGGGGAAPPALTRAEKEAADRAAQKAVNAERSSDWMRYAQKYLLGMKVFKEFPEGWGPAWLPLHRGNTLRDSRSREIQDAGAATVSYDGRALYASGSELGTLIRDAGTNGMAARHEVPVLDKVTSHLIDVCLELQDALEESLSGLKKVPDPRTGGPDPVCALSATQFRHLWDTLNASVGVLLARRKTLVLMLRAKASTSGPLERKMAEQAAELDAVDTMEAELIADAVSQEDIEEARRTARDARTAVTKKHAKEGLLGDKNTKAGKGKEKL